MKLGAGNTVVIFQNQETDPGDKLLAEIEAYLKDHQIITHRLVLPSRNAPVTSPPNIEPELVIVVGGDGTFLRASHVFARHHIPLVGVNTGHLGFLTRIEASQIRPYLNRILEGEAVLENRMLLTISPGEVLALNDVVVKNANPSRLAKINVFVGETHLATYHADGLIVATPTGSTAYNLSAGGPVVDPATDVLVLTPICPHSLSADPIILPAGKTMRIESDIKNAADLLISVDGDDASRLQPGKSTILSKSPHTLAVLTFPSETDSFYAILKRKLSWAANPRLT